MSKGVNILLFYSKKTIIFLHGFIVNFNKL